MQNRNLLTVETWIMAILVSAIPTNGSAFSALLEVCDGDMTQARAREFTHSQGGPTHNGLAEVSHPVRGGKTAFRHWIDQQGEQSELAMMQTPIDGVYWYGWSMLIPEDFDCHGSDSIVMQLATGPASRRCESPHGTNGSYIQIQSEGQLVFRLQHQGRNRDATHDEFTLAKDMSPLKGKWLDFVMHAKWTGQQGGFLKLWMKVHDNNYLQMINYQGPTWWDDEGHGPYFKMGLNMGEPGWQGPQARTLYTDEYRLGGGSSCFNEVAPCGAELRTREAKSGCLEYRTYVSPLNQQDIPVMVYTPPGYKASGERYPVVYNLHGAGGGSPERQWKRIQATLTDAMENQKLRPVIYVFVNGLGDTFFIDTEDGSIKPESSIIQELIPFIDTNFRTIPTQQGRAIDGFSMGGCACLMLAFKHPELFSSVVSYGGAVIPPAIAPFSPIAKFHKREHYQAHSPWTWAHKNADAIRQGLRVRMICGDQDRLYAANEKFVQLLRKLEIPIDWITAPGVAHETGKLYRLFGLDGLTFMFTDTQGLTGQWSDWTLLNADMGRN